MKIRKISAEESGAETLALSGEFSLTDANELKDAMIEALESSADALHLDLSEVTQAGLTFFQLLFALASQAKLDGKRAVLEVPLPEPLRRAAGELGLAQRDFDQAFSCGDIQ